MSSKEVEDVPPILLAIIIVITAIYWVNYHSLECFCKMIVSSLQFIPELIISINWSAIIHYIKIACVETGNVTLYSIELAYNGLFSIMATLWTVFGYLLVGIIPTLYTVLSYLIVGVNTLISHFIYILTTSLAHGIQHIFSSTGLTQDTLKSIIIVIVIVYLELRRRNRHNRNRERGYETSVQMNNFDGYKLEEMQVKLKMEEMQTKLRMEEKEKELEETERELEETQAKLKMEEMRAKLRMKEKERELEEMQAKLKMSERKLEKEVESKQCVVCMDKSRKLMIKPCNHYCVCRNCSRHINKCPMCTKRIISTENVYNA